MVMIQFQSEFQAQKPSFDPLLIQRRRLDSGGSLERWHTLTCVSTLPQLEVGMAQAPFSEI